MGRQRDIKIEENRDKEIQSDQNFSEYKED